MKPIRIIPKLDIKNNLLIKGINLEGLRVLGEPSLFAEQYFKDGADELIFNDAIASLYGVNYLHKIVKSLSKNVSIPICVGGGLQKIEDIEKMFYSGADKIFLNSSIIKDKFLLRKVVNHFGSANITVCIEVIHYQNNFYTSYLSGREIAKINPLDWAKYCENQGCGEILITSVEKEGLMEGTNIKLFEKISKNIKIPILANGGFGKPKDVYDLVKNVNISGVVIASLFHYEYIHFLNNNKLSLTKIGNFSFIQKIIRQKKQNFILKLKKYLKDKKINVRI